MNLPAICYTEPFCLADLADQRDYINSRALIRIGKDIADKLNDALGPDRVDIRYVNILNMDQESSFYNPDGMIGRFQIVLNS